MLAAAQPDERIEYLWPCNVQAWAAWTGVQTQWRTGMGGATGLDYAGVRAYIELHLPRRRWAEVFDGVCACERATLDVWAERREREEAARQAEQLAGNLPR